MKCAILNSSSLTDESETVDVKRGIGLQKINIVTGLRLHKNISVKSYQHLNCLRFRCIISMEGNIAP